MANKFASLRNNMAYESWLDGRLEIPVGPPGAITDADEGIRENYSDGICWLLFSISSHFGGPFRRFKK